MNFATALLPLSKNVSAMKSETSIEDDSGFTASEILYHKLQISVSPDLAFTYSYLNGSGVFWNYDGIDDFLGALRISPAPLVPDAGLYGVANSAPNVVVKHKCYVVIELHGAANLRFRSGQPAIKMGDDYGHLHYCSLVHVDTTWEHHPTVAPDDDEPCYLAYFGINDPIPESGHQLYYLYFQFDQSGDVILAMIDPAIKNRGGDDRMVQRARDAVRRKRSGREAGDKRPSA